MAGRSIMFMSLFLVATATATSLQAQPSDGARTRMRSAIDHAIHAGGPLLLPAERALVERKCGYPAGSWDGRDFSMNNGVLVCSNGRRVDDPEVRAMMENASPRISRRVREAMNRPEVRAAIAEVSREATETALARLRDDGFRP